MLKDGKLVLVLALVAVSGGVVSAPAQENSGGPDRRDRRTDRFPGGFQRPFGPGRDGGFGGPGGPGGPGGAREERKLVTQFDKDGNGRLNEAERQAAREMLAKERQQGINQGRRGPRMGGRESSTPPSAGAKISPAEVQTVSPAIPLYASNVVRTLFLEFERPDWEKELGDFKDTDVEVPAKLTVDGKTYPDVGVHFRGASSYFMVGEGYKRSLTVSLDFAHENQRLLGHRNLHLLSSHADPSFVRTILFNQIAREYIPAPKANFARVVINGENWGVYVNAQAFDKDFLKEWFGTTKGARWKAPGSPRGGAGLAYLGEDPAPYQRLFEIKSKDDTNSWNALIKLCRVLNQTPANELEKALSPLLDLDGALKFLALENVFINNDGYWARASDYNLYLDEKGRFHIIPHDANETFRAPSGPGMGGGMSVRGVELDPLAGANDSGKPLLSKLLAAPALRERYLAYVRDIAEKWVDWNKLGPLVQQYQDLIAAEVKADTRKLDSFEAFAQSATRDAATEGFRGPGRGGMSLKSFVEQRREYLLAWGRKNGLGR